MKTTRANVAQFVADKGYDPVQIDGIPEGFSFQKASITIAGVYHIGEYVAFIPMSEWENDSVVHGNTPEELLNNYKNSKVKSNGK